VQFYLLGQFGWQIEYGDNKFIAVSRNFDNKVLISYDGVNWDSTAPLDIGLCKGIVYGDGKFVIILNDYISYSTDAINWTKITIPIVPNNYLTGIVYGNGIFVLVGTSKWYYSTDGITWNVNNNFSNPSNSSTPIYGNNKFIRLTNGLGSGFISSDGINWTAFSSGRACISAVYDGEKFVCRNQIIPVGENSVVFISNTNDFINFEDTFAFPPPTLSWSNIEYGDGLLIIFYYGDFLLSSKNSESWKKGKLPIQGKLATLSSGDNKFLASYDNGTVKYSIV
jgi:hypothetical protein